MEQRSEITEKLMNIIMDVIDDIIIVHDSEHTVIWMNRAGEKAFGKTVEEIYGKNCYTLFEHSTPCSDCSLNTNRLGPINASHRRIIPKNNVEYLCSSTPYFENGSLQMVVQHLSPVRNLIVPESN